jgi:hypothetical protein
MPGTWDKLKKFGQNLWNGMKTVWHGIREYAPKVISVASNFLGPVGKVIGKGVNAAIGAAGMIEDNVNTLKAIKNEYKRQEEEKKAYDDYIKEYNAENEVLKRNEIDRYMGTLTLAQIESVKRSKSRKGQK